LEVLEYFMNAGVPARTIEISEALGIPNSSADEILRTLAAAGYLTYNQATKLYAPSYKIVANASSIEQSFFGGGQINEIMEDMSRETGGTVFVTQQNDCWSESIAETLGDWKASPDAAPSYPAQMICFERNSWRPGTNFAAAMLAQQSNVDIIQLAARTQRLGLGPKGPTLMKHLVDRIAQTRSRGFSMCRRSRAMPPTPSAWSGTPCSQATMTCVGYCRPCSRYSSATMTESAAAGRSAFNKGRTPEGLVRHHRRSRRGRSYGAGPL
jgi:hypothetical protein